MENAYRTDFEGTSTDLSLSSFTALQSLCEYTASNSEDELFGVLMPVLQLMEKTLDVNTYGEKKSKDL